MVMSTYFYHHIIIRYADMLIRIIIIRMLVSGNIEDDHCDGYISELTKVERSHS